MNLLSVPPELRPQTDFEFSSPIAGPIGGRDLERLASLMAADGIPLQPTRMLYDSAYACERLAQGHASSNRALRELSAVLFSQYQLAGEWIGLAAH